jgi:hypothetical protein
LSEVGLRSCRENSTVYHLIREIGFQEEAALIFSPPRDTQNATCHDGMAYENINTDELISS